MPAASPVRLSSRASPWLRRLHRLARDMGPGLRLVAVLSGILVIFISAVEKTCEAAADYARTKFPDVAGTDDEDGAEVPDDGEAPAPAARTAAR